MFCRVMSQNKNPKHTDGWTGGHTVTVNITYFSSLRLTACKDICLEGVGVLPLAEPEPILDLKY